VFSSNTPWKSNPDKIDPEIQLKGTSVLRFNAMYLGRNEIEIWVQKVAQHSGQKVDWSTWGASLDEDDLTVNIMGLGDLEKIRNTMKEMLLELNKLSKEHMEKKWKNWITHANQKDRFTEQDIDQLKEKSLKPSNQPKL
jgi:hypothetical protein